MKLKLMQQLALLMVAWAVVSCNSSHTRPTERRTIDVELRDGDLAFRRGIGFMSQVVLSANLDGVYSHVGLTLKVDDKWCVVHEVPYEGRTIEDDKIYCEEVGDFFDTHNAAQGAIYRLPALDSVQLSQIRGYALQHLAAQTPFDHDYDLSDDKRQYCSELVWRSYLSAAIDISEGRRTKMPIPGSGNGEIIMPVDIELNKKLERVFVF